MKLIPIFQNAQKQEKKSKTQHNHFSSSKTETSSQEDSNGNTIKRTIIDFEELGFKYLGSNEGRMREDERNA